MPGEFDRVMLDWIRRRFSGALEMPQEFDRVTLGWIRRRFGTLERRRSLPLSGRPADA